jgi:serine phosphatase RsbU (regulator of sigma subunit)
MSEPDRLSPPGLPALVPTIGPELASRLAQVPSNDSVLAATMRDQPVIVGAAALKGGADPARRPPARVVATRISGGAPTELRRFDAVLQSVDEINAAARGQGLLNANVDGGAVRRLALVADVNGVIMPSLALEMLRVAQGRPEIALRVKNGRVRAIGTGTFMVPTQADGSVWLRYGRHAPARFIPAADVLSGSATPDLFRDRLVLIGVTALGLAERHRITGTGDRDGVEIQAEVIESLLERTLLARPSWARWVECAFVLIGGVLVIVTVPLQRGRAVVSVLTPLVFVAFAGSFVLYSWALRLVDAATPSLAVALLFVTMLVLTLAEAERHRRALRRQVEQQREQAARVEGELSAARRIQMGILPKAATVLAHESRVALHIVLEPAREVGGDLYDFFMLDRDRLFILLGDVSGKGLPGSLFMAVSKSLYKSTALRRGRDVAAMMREANAEISRDNTEALFVTMFAATLDATTGTLEYCNAGHDQPYLISRDGVPHTQLSQSGGPPLCVLDDFPYEAAACRLEPGDTLCLVTDGVTEARNANGELFGRARLEGCLARASDMTVEQLAVGLRDAVAAFVGGSEPADDLAILVVRWRGPDAVSGR